MNLKKITLGLLILPASIWAQVADLNQKIPNDPDVRIGKLESNKKVLKSKKTFFNESLFKKNAIINLNR